MGSICHDGVAFWGSNERFLRWEEKEQKKQTCKRLNEKMFPLFYSTCWYHFCGNCCQDSQGKRPEPQKNIISGENGKFLTNCPHHAKITPFLTNFRCKNIGSNEKKNSHETKYGSEILNKTGFVHFNVQDGPMMSKSVCLLLMTSLNAHFRLIK